MSGFKGFTKEDVDEFLEALREFAKRDGDGGRYTSDNAQEKRSVPRYEDVSTSTDYDSNLEDSEMLPCTPNLSTMNRMSWNDTPFVHALRTCQNVELPKSASSSSDSNDSMEQNVDDVDEVEGAQMHWVVLIIILSALMPFIAYMIYKILQ